MTQFQPFTIGWDKGATNIEYGAGLMHLQPGGACNCSREAVSRPSGAGCYYSGHGGDTFGFVTMSGFFPTLNASISLAMNQRHVGLLDALQCELVSTLLPLANYTTCAAVEDKLCGGEAARSSAATCLACMRDSAHRAELAAVGCTNNSTLDFCSNVGTPCQVRAEALCGSARNVSQVDCIMCCGAHQTALEAAACTDPDLEAFCNASQAAASDSS